MKITRFAQQTGLQHEEVGMASSTSYIVLLAVFLMLHIPPTSSKVVNILDFGARPSDKSAAAKNSWAIGSAMSSAVEGDTVLVPNGMLFYIMAANATDRHNMTLQIDGHLQGVTDNKDINNWPYSDGRYDPFIRLSNSTHLTITSRQGGVVNGDGVYWWNRAIFGPPLKQQRPYTFVIDKSTDVLVENLLLQNSPGAYICMHDVMRVEVRNITITTDRKKQRHLKSLAKSSGIQPEDLNTGGMNIAGRDVLIHSSYILNDDDSVAVKPCNSLCKHTSCSQNFTIENMTLTGVGATIGSVPPNSHVNCVKNVTFRNITMPKTMKGIYIKSNPHCPDDNTSTAIISDILYEDVKIIKPSWWPIWIGPQQQHEPHVKLGEKCALDYPIDSHCPTQGCVTFSNITLRRVYVDRPRMTPGVILGNSSNPMSNILFDSVVVNKPGIVPLKFHRNYHCVNADVKFVNSKPEISCSKT